MDWHGDWFLMPLLACGEGEGSEEPVVNSKSDLCLLTFKSCVGILADSEGNS